MGSTPKGRDEWEPSRKAHDELVVATVTSRSDDVAVCAISSLPRSEHVLEAEWIAATGDSFVALDRMR
ncbi:hypothetical protein [Haloarchaeobius litoreus]|uniref:Uncharacterized protein n=1 Tax=Haloarchaeobius litoreus TaxID=755306 RepID=A0ABD6DR60_9EURY|nr:hypothetical protein [Haloarchaeobius litoreus]